MSKMKAVKVVAYHKNLEMGEADQPKADGPLDVPKGHVGDHSSSSPWQGVLPGQTSTTHSAHPPSDKDLGSERAVPALGDSTDQHRSPVSPHGDDWMRHNAEFYPHQVSGQDSLPQDVDYIFPWGSLIARIRGGAIVVHDGFKLLLHLLHERLLLFWGHVRWFLALGKSVHLGRFDDSTSGDAAVSTAVAIGHDDAHEIQVLE